ncbi:MAG: nucleotidyltransferase domain-containing protein [Chloroflexaceae bacterium]|nr:nucleotidyltransferase domain-containing protein [Chloroflexaceae bacterium]
MMVQVQYNFEYILAQNKALRPPLQEQRRARRARYDEARQLARDGAALLKAQFGIERVLLVGSLLHFEQFRLNSNINLAVWGLNSRDYVRAVHALQRFGSDILFDLGMMEQADPYLQMALEIEGLEL